jgi:diadenosine tetraphosphate (Ap4A) HIT family hydrolase
VAFEDIAPQAAIHILIIPRGAYKDLTDFTTQASEDEILDFNKAIAATIKKYNLKENGYRAVYNSGDHGGQEVPHLHMHILGGEKLPPMIGG